MRSSHGDKKEAVDSALGDLFADRHETSYFVRRIAHYLNTKWHRALCWHNASGNKIHKNLILFKPGCSLQYWQERGQKDNGCIYKLNMYSHLHTQKMFNTQSTGPLETICFEDLKFEESWIMISAFYWPLIVGYLTDLFIDWLRINHEYLVSHWYLEFSCM